MDCYSSQYNRRYSSFLALVGSPQEFLAQSVGKVVVKFLDDREPVGCLGNLHRAATGKREMGREGGCGVATLPHPSIKTEPQNDSADMNLRSLRPTPHFTNEETKAREQKDLKAHNEIGIAVYQLRFLSFVPNYQSNTCLILSFFFFFKPI